jgi:hypothetical protein
MEINLLPLHVKFQCIWHKENIRYYRACGAVCNTKGGGMKEAKPAKLLDILS